MPVEEARKQLGKLVRDASAGQPVVIGRRGTEQAVLISAEEYERLRGVAEDAARNRFRAALEAIEAGVRRQRVPRRVVAEAVRSTRRP